MRVLCIKQPWAHIIIHGTKRIENRTWTTPYRGPLLVAASARRITAQRLPFLEKHLAERRTKLDHAAMQYGGIIGIVELADCLEDFETPPRLSASPWYQGPVAWVLNNPQPLPFMPIKGTLGLFEPPPHIKAKLTKLGFL